MIGYNGKWEYRILKTTEEEKESFEIIQIYYEDDGSVAFWGNDLSECKFSSLEEIKDVIKHIITTLVKPVLTKEQIQESTTRRKDATKGL